MDLSEQVVNTQEIFNGHIVHLRVDTVRLPDGRESRREIVAHRGAVCMVPVTDDGDVLMVRQFRLAAGKVLLEIPAGTLEEGEQPGACAARELEEETGYASTHLEPLFAAFLAPGYSTELVHAYLATGLFKPDNRATMDADENIDLVRIPLSDVSELITNGELQDSKSIASILTALQVIGKRNSIQQKVPPV